MKSCKKNMVERAFSKGYHFGFSGRPKDRCPHNNPSQRQAWLNGWTLGWVDRLEGNRFPEPNPTSTLTASHQQSQYE